MGARQRCLVAIEVSEEVRAGRVNRDPPRACDDAFFAARHGQFSATRVPCSKVLLITRRIQGPGPLLDPQLPFVRKHNDSAVRRSQRKDEKPISFAAAAHAANHKVFDTGSFKYAFHLGTGVSEQVGNRPTPVGYLTLGLRMTRRKE
jgi:hypothetical protein